MPSCSPCGLVVEFSRHCYRSEWRLFRDAPEVKTSGFYYFSEPGAPTLPGFHHFGSRDWLDRNWVNVQGLGEDQGTKHLHLDGRFAGAKPLAQAVGGPECFSAGDLIANAANPFGLFHGYPLECYLPVNNNPPIPPRPNPQDFERASAYDRCLVQRLWARVIAWLYANDQDAIKDTLTEFFTQEVTVVVRREVGLMPALVTIVADNWAAAIMDGTRDFDQLAIQAIQSLDGPADVGGFSTCPLWNDAAAYVNGRLEVDGVNDTRPIFLCGHSYGGAAALTLASKFRFASANRLIKYLTFGCPKVGDGRMVALLESCLGLCLRNDNDVVTIVPPDRVVLSPIIVWFPLLVFGPWFDWEVPPNVQTQDDDGLLTAGFEVGLTWSFLFALATRLAAGQPFSQVFPGHQIAEYQRRLTLRCPDPAWPVGTEIEEVIADGGEGVAVGNSERSTSPNGGAAIGIFERITTPNGGILIGDG